MDECRVVHQRAGRCREDAEMYWENKILAGKAGDEPDRGRGHAAVLPVRPGGL